MSWTNVLRPMLTTPFREWAYARSGFNQLGLYRDDMLRETADVKEALKRMPRHLVDERNFRIVRALHLDAGKKILPRDQWTKWSDDVRYMAPYLEEVIREREEKERWEAAYDV